MHARVLNSRALEIAKIDRDTPDIPEGVIQRDEDGEPTGALYEAAHWHVEKFRNPVTHQDRIRYIAGLTQRFASLGITGVTEVMEMPDDYEMYMDAKKAGFRQPCDSVGSARRRIYVSQGSGNKKSAWGQDINQDENISVEQAVLLYTKRAAAVCNFSSVGQLKPGYHADFIVLDKDIFSISPEDIDKVSVDETFIGGEKIYKRENQ